MVEAKCIYCGKTVSVNQGEGDHVIPDRLGRFRRGHRFRRICRGCNGDFSPAEEQLIRCAPESFHLRTVNPKAIRRSAAKQWLGAHGSPAPKFGIVHHDHVEQVKFGPTGDLVLENPHLTIVDEEASQFHVELFRSLTPQTLKQKIERLTTRKIKRAHLSCPETDWGFYVELLEQFWPGSKVQERETREVGRHPVEVEIKFEFNNDYWRALAKIGFHYYLATNRNGYNGSERHFDGIRAFLRGEGKKHEFFDRVPPMFDRGLGPLPDGSMLVTSTWQHWLAFCDVNGEVVAGVQLFLGPNNPAPIHTIFLGSYRSRLFVPESVSGHLYEYTGDAGNSYDGIVRLATPMRRR